MSRHNVKGSFEALTIVNFFRSGETPRSKVPAKRQQLMYRAQS